MNRLFVLTLSLFLSGGASAGEIFLPATFRGAGANASVWRTEISVANISNDIHAQVPVTATITLHRENAEPLSVTMPLADMEVLTIPDAIHDWFSLEEGGGLVRVTWDDPNARLTARARIYNVSAAGEYGQGVPGVRPENLVSDVFLPGLSGVNGNRTNVGVSNPHDEWQLVWITLYDTSGLSRGAFTTAIPPRSYRQFNDIFAHFQAGPLHAAMVRVSGTNQTIYAYASVVRNDTGDATFVEPAP